MVRHQEGSSRRTHHLLTHKKSNQGSHQGLQIQDAFCIRSLSNQHCHHREGHSG